jgi:hypothetical protein
MVVMMEGASRGMRTDNTLYHPNSSSSKLMNNGGLLSSIVVCSLY